METNNREGKDFYSKFQNPIFLKSLSKKETYFKEATNINTLERKILFLEQKHPEELNKYKFDKTEDTIHTLEGFVDDVFPEQYRIQEFDNAIKVWYETSFIEEFYPVYLDDFLYIKPIELKIGFAYMIHHLNMNYREFNWDFGIVDDHFMDLFDFELDDLDEDEKKNFIKSIDIETEQIRKLLNKIKKYYNFDIKRFLDYNPRDPLKKALKEAILNIINVNIDKAFSLEVMDEYSHFYYQDCFRIQYIENNLIQDRINDNIDYQVQEGISLPASSFLVSDKVEDLIDQEAVDELEFLCSSINEFRTIINKIYNGKS